MPRFVFVVLIEQALVSAIKAISGSCQRFQCPIVSHVWCDDHEAGVEAVWPANIGCCSKGSVNIEQLIHCPQRNHVRVKVYDLSELGLAPEGDLGECEEEIATVHEKEIARVRIKYAFDWY